MSEGCVPLLRACPAEASALGRDAAAAITSTGLRAVEQEPDLLCRRDLFFHRLREEAKPAALSFLGTACEGSPSRHVPWEGTRGCPAPVVFSAGMQVANLYSWGWETQGLQLIPVVPVVAGVCFSLGSPPVRLIPQHLHPPLGSGPAP